MIYKTSIIKLFVIIIPVFLIIMFFPSCDDPVPFPSTGALLVTMETFDDATYNSLTFKTSMVEVIWSPTSDGTNSQKITVDTANRTFVFPAQGAKFPIAQYEIPEGYVHQIRMYPESITISYLGVSYPIFLPSGEQTGFKIVPEYKEPYFVEHNGTTSIKVNFNFPDRIVKTGGKHEFILHPTVPSVIVLPEELPSIDPDIVLLITKSGVTYSQVEQACQQVGAVIKKNFPPMRMYEIKLPPRLAIKDGVDYFNSLPITQTASLSVHSKATSIPPNDTNNYQQCQQTVNLQQAWQILENDNPAVNGDIGSYNTVIAVLDSGVEIDHRDLLFNIWINQGELPDIGIVDADGDGRISFFDLNAPANSGLNIADTNGNNLVDAKDILADNRFVDNTDDDGNWFIDDLVGWDWVDGDNDPSPSVNGNHGTIVAGILAAVTDNTFDVSGTIWKASIMPLRILEDQAGPWGQALGMWYASYMEADVANMSIGTTFQRKKQDHSKVQRIDIDSFSWLWMKEGIMIFHRGIFDTLAEFNIDNTLFVVASSNEGVNLDDSQSFNSPGQAMKLAMDAAQRAPRVILVGASTADGLNRASFSNHGSIIDIYAPGEQWIALDLGSSTITNRQGTSFAAPLISGIIALTTTRLDYYYPAMSRRDKMENLYQYTRNAGVSHVYGILIDAPTAVGNVVIP